jgi:hypothetical protein
LQLLWGKGMSKELNILEELFAGKKLYICGSCSYWKIDGKVIIVGLALVNNMINRGMLRCVPVEFNDGKISKWEVVPK